jgi:hypothetical protein
MTVRIGRLPLWPLMAGGAVSGFVAGFFAGTVLGAVLVWFAGAVLDWHRQLGFTLGVTEDLLPLGEQIGVLQVASDLWWIVVPGTGILVGLLTALIGLLAGGLMAALFNRFGHGLLLDVEVAEPGESLAAVPPPDGVPTAQRRRRARPASQRH